MNDRNTMIISLFDYFTIGLFHYLTILQLLHDAKLRKKNESASIYKEKFGNIKKIPYLCSCQKN